MRSVELLPEARTFLARQGELLGEQCSLMHLSVQWLQYSRVLSLETEDLIATSTVTGRGLNSNHHTDQIEMGYAAP
jgi:hypothetical protein